MNDIIEWSLSHKVELCGTLSGLIYVWFSIRQSLITWPAGIITSILYVWVFFDARLYAMMGLQGYYIIISIYGWWSWHRGVEEETSDEKLHVTRTNRSLWIKLFIVSLLLTLIMYFILAKTDSPLPFGDAFTTALSIIATWMLARKKIEHWMIWIFIDLVSVALYIYRDLQLTAFLFLVYSIMAGIGFYEWRKEITPVYEYKK